MLLEFYRGEAPDSEGRMFEDILKQDDDWLEYTHDFIQWLFPLREASRFNPDAPLLSDEDVAAFKRDPFLAANLKMAFERMLAFYGFQHHERGVEFGSNSIERLDNWLSPGNHNFLRITRILKSLTILGKREEALKLFGALHTLTEVAEIRRTVSEETIRFWKEAVS